jgi:hypothetical protein
MSAQRWLSPSFASLLGHVEDERVAAVKHRLQETLDVVGTAWSGYV